MKTEVEPLDERFFVWLYSMVGTVTTRNPSRNHWKLAKQLFTKEFTFYVPNDDNRAEAGRKLREEFLDMSPFDEWTEAKPWLAEPCSFFEMLVALSRDLAFESYSGEGEDATGDWFWRFMDNLDLSRFNDRVYNRASFEIIDAKLEAVNHRDYNYNGQGGLFPLRRARTDQRQVEIWYQMAAYLDERLPS